MPIFNAPSVRVAAVVPQTRVRSVIRPALGAVARHRLRVNMQEIELPLGVTTVGRSPRCRISIEDPMLSREHFDIEVERDGRVLLRDRGSRNGTCVNGVRVQGDVELHDQDRIRGGGQEIVFVTVAERGPLRTTARLRCCTACGHAYVLEAVACPRCGDVPAPGDWLVRDGAIATPRADSTAGWAAELALECADRALLLFRLDEAERALARASDAIAACHDATLVERTHAMAIRLASASGDCKWITWAIEDLHARKEAPSPAVVERLAALPPIVVEGAVPAIDALVGSFPEGSLDFPARVRVESLAAITKRVADWRALHDPSPAPVGGRPTA